MFRVAEEILAKHSKGNSYRNSDQKNDQRGGGGSSSRIAKTAGVY